VKTLPLTLVLSCMTWSVFPSIAAAKDRVVPDYQQATFSETHSESVRMNCYGAGDSSMSNCHDAQVLVYTVKVKGEVYTLTPYNTRPHRESLWQQPAGAAVAVWNDGNRLHIRIGSKESQYDIVGTAFEDAAR
jgi:hypothetical protein